MSLDAYLTTLPDDEPTAAACDHCGKPRINQLDPLACQCPDDEPPACRCCGEEPAAEGREHCYGCLEVGRESARYAERAAQAAEQRGDVLRARYIREAAAGRDAA